MLENLMHIGAKLVGIKNLRLELNKTERSSGSVGKGDLILEILWI